MNAATEDQYASHQLPPTFDPLAPELAVAMTLDRMLDPNAHTFDHPIDVARRLRVFSKAVEDGDLSHVRRILANQMVMLERLFHHLMARTKHFEYSYKDYERVARLATRAQVQMARTAMILQSMTNSAAKAEKNQAPQKTNIGATDVLAQNNKVHAVSLRQTHAEVSREHHAKAPRG